jgi:RNA polymerase sigma factor (sigma-70 family)
MRHRPPARWNPLRDDHRIDPPDETLVRHAAAGDRAALGALLARHQGFIFNLALRMLQTREDAQDATQEILVRVATRIASFRGESAFRTWAYRIAVRHLLDRRRSGPERTVHGFDCLGAYLADAPDEPLAPDEPGAASPETRLLVEEARLACTLGMLLCLDRDQRLVFVLGEVFEVSDAVGGEVLGISRDNYRQRLARAREQLSSFMRGRCGLIEPRNPCRCARKTKAFIRDGIVDPERLVFASRHVAAARATAEREAHTLDDLRGASVGALFREQPEFEAPDLAARIEATLARPEWREFLATTNGDAS